MSRYRARSRKEDAEARAPVYRLSRLTTNDSFSEWQRFSR